MSESQQTMTVTAPPRPTTSTMPASPTIAVVIPCHNEELTVGKVVDDFRAALPEARLYVFDNCSTDATASLAAEHGACVIYEPRKGKGFAVEAIFDQVDADYYVMVDGDDTYPAERVRDLLAPVLSGRADMAVGARLASYDHGAFRPMHVVGNALVRGLINGIFGVALSDILSGYRAFNRHFVCSVPVVSSGFEVETELTVQALYARLRLVEVPVPYRARPTGSASKLRTFHDGFNVLWKLFSLVRSIKPLTFFGLVGLVFFALAVTAAAPVLRAYFDGVAGHAVDHWPLAVLAVCLLAISAASVFLGLLLHAINWRFKELHSIVVRGKHESDR